MAPKQPFLLFLVTSSALIALTTWYCAHVALRFGDGINFQFKLVGIIPLFAVAGRLSLRAKWVLILLFTALVIALDHQVTMMPNSPLIDPLLAGLMRALNFGIPMLTIAALVLRYFQLIAQQQAMLQEHATTDPLTGLMNRRRLREVWMLAEAEGRRGSFPLSIVICDVDRFKSINDTYGHETGDEVLRSLGQLLRREVRITDSVCRWGGEEFLLLLPHSDNEQALMTSQRICEKVADTPLKIGAHTFNITITMGVATLKGEEKFETAVHRADVALYTGKTAGRNRVVAAEAFYPGTSSAA